MSREQSVASDLPAISFTLSTVVFAFGGVIPYSNIPDSLFLILVRNMCLGLYKKQKYQITEDSCELKQICRRLLNGKVWALVRVMRQVPHPSKKGSIRNFALLIRSSPVHTSWLKNNIHRIRFPLPRTPRAWMQNVSVPERGNPGLRPSHNNLPDVELLPVLQARLQRGKTYP